MKLRVDKISGNGIGRDNTPGHWHGIPAGSMLLFNGHGGDNNKVDGKKDRTFD